MMYPREKLLSEIPAGIQFFLITGPGRSGTSILTHLLRSHREVAIVSEPYLPRLDKNMTEDQAAELYLLLKYFSVEITEKSYIGIAEKAGAYLHGDFDHITKYFASKIILIVRDPRDCLASANERWFNIPGKKTSFNGKEDYLLAYKKIVMWSYDQRKKNIPLTTIRYEDLITNTKKVLDTAFGFLGTSYKYDDVIRVSESRKFESRGDKKLKKTGGEIHRNSIGRWKKELLTSDIALVNKLLSEEMKFYKYL